jgi:O-antigen ligase
MDRLNIWEDGVRFFVARPLVGWGSGSYYTSLYFATPEAEQMNAISGPRNPEIHTAHNAVITIAAENGLLGLVPFMGMLISLGLLLWRSPHQARWGILAFMLQQLFDDQWLHPITSILLGMAVAVCLFEWRGIADRFHGNGRSGKQIEAKG